MFHISSNITHYIFICCMLVILNPRSVIMVWQNIAVSSLLYNASTNNIISILQIYHVLFIISSVHAVTCCITNNPQPIRPILINLTVGIAQAVPLIAGCPTWLWSTLPGDSLQARAGWVLPTLPLHSPWVLQVSVIGWPGDQIEWEQPFAREDPCLRFHSWTVAGDWKNDDMTQLLVLLYQWPVF